MKFILSEISTQSPLAIGKKIPVESEIFVKYFNPSQAKQGVGV